MHLGYFLLPKKVPNSGAIICRGDGWVLRGLALIEAAGGLTEAAALLVLLITRMLRQRKLALPVPDSAAGMPDSFASPDKLFCVSRAAQETLL